MVNTIIEQSMLRRGAEESVINYNVIDLREFGKGNYRQIDDTPYGGGHGMVLMPKPLISAIEFAMDWLGDREHVRVIFPSPQGETWSHQKAESLINHDNFIFICGHYKGIDQRVIDCYVTDEYSIGDYVVSSGEIPAMIMIDSIVRLIPGVLNSRESAESDTFYGDLLDNPCFTKPREVNGMEVPEVLLNGHHKEIEDWKQSKRKSNTRERRPDLWHNYLIKNEMSE